MQPRRIQRPPTSSAPSMTTVLRPSAAAVRAAPASPPAPIRNEPRQEFSLAPETETRSGLRLAPVLRDSRLSRDIADCVRVRFALQRERGQERRFLKVEFRLELLADFSRHAEPFALLRRKPKTRILLC